jgi:hypothetical protein
MTTSTSLKHTAGHWTIHWGMAQSGDGHWIMDSQDHGELSRIAMVAFHDDTSGDETRANAKVIAAAPDLLAALIACCDQLGSYVDGGSDDARDFWAVKMANAAIEKATT